MKKLLMLSALLSISALNAVRDRDARDNARQEAKQVDRERQRDARQEAKQAVRDAKRDAKKETNGHQCAGGCCH